MKTNLLALLLGILALTSGASSLSAADFPKYGFQIDPLDTNPEGAATQVLHMFLPAKEGFSPNVNVVIQTYPGSLKDYVALSKGQFEQMKWTVSLEKQVSENEWFIEYAGTMQEVALHWYCRIFYKSGKVYLVTATSRQADWDANAPLLKKCVDSFGLK